jgi:hypothetical protein
MPPEIARVGSGGGLFQVCANPFLDRERSGLLEPGRSTAGGPTEMKQTTKRPCKVSEWDIQVSDEAVDEALAKCYRLLIAAGERHARERKRQERHSDGRH